MASKGEKGVISRIEDLKGVERAAVVLLALGEQKHSLWDLMDEQEIKEISQAMSNLGLVGSSVVEDLLIDFVTREWLAVVAISISGHSQTTTLAKMIKSVREHSLNPHIGVMIGGPMVTLRPELVDELGADGTAANAASAVVLAKKLLAEGLIAEHENKSKDQG